MPDNDIAGDPTPIHHFDGEAKRDQAKGLFRNAHLWSSRPRLIRCCLLLACIFLAVPALIEIGVAHAGFCTERISQVHPARAGWLQHPANLVEYGAEFLDIFLERGFETKLALDAIVTQIPIRRRGQDTVYGIVGNVLEMRECVSLKDNIGFDVLCRFVDLPVKFENERF